MISFTSAGSKRYKMGASVAELVFWAIVGCLRSQKYEGGKSILRCAPKSVRRWCHVEVRFKIMKADLIEAASKVITNQQILVNMVSRRVRQLSLGHRPLVEYAPGLREADIALTEIANGKLTFESTFGQNGTAEPAARVMLFPGVTSSKSAKKAA